MPPVEDGGPLSSREIELIKKWIDDGARFGSGSASGLGKLDKDLDVGKFWGCLRESLTLTPSPI